MDSIQGHTDLYLFSRKFDFRNDCGEVSFRLDFYSKKDFIEKFQECAQNFIGEFSERMLSPEESERIDLESVSASLGNSVNEISERKAFIFFWENDPKDFENLCQVFVSPYFLYVYCKGDMINLLAQRLKSLEIIVECLKDNISPLGVRFVSRYTFILDKEYLPLFGMRYFNIPFNAKILQDTHVKFIDGDSIINVDSEMDIAEIEDFKQIATMNITSTVYAPLMYIAKGSIMDSLGSLVNATEKYMTICAE